MNQYPFDDMWWFSYPWDFNEKALSNETTYIKIRSIFFSSNYTKYNAMYIPFCHGPTNKIIITK